MAKQHQVKLVWVQTTSKAANHPDNQKIQEFNRIAARLMAAAKMPVIDLNGFTAQLIAKHGLANIMRPDKVHFTPSASGEQARMIAAELIRILAPAGPIHPKPGANVRQSSVTPPTQLDCE